MVKLYRKIKDTAGGFHSWWESDVGIIRKPNSEINLKKEVNIEPIKAEEVKPEIRIGWLQRFLDWLKVVAKLIKTKIWQIKHIVLRSRLRSR